MFLACVVSLENFDNHFFFFIFFSLALRCLDFCFASFVARYDSSVSAKIDMVLLAQIVLIEESFADARNADKNLFASSFLKFFLCQWLIPRISFHDGNLPGIVSEKIRTGVREESEDSMMAEFHFS